MAPERWLVVSVRPTDPEDRDEVVEALVALGGAAVEERGAELVTYLAPPPSPARLVRRLERLLEERCRGEAAVAWHWQPHEDWARTWRRGLRPRRVGRRIVVAPTWTRPRLAEGDVLVCIDPEMAFGTGEHATTRAALRLLEGVVRPDDRVLDVGTGSGILAIAAARLGAGRVLGLEIEAEAVANARANVDRNGVADRVTVELREVDPVWLEALPAGGHDLLLANVLSGVLVPLLPAFRRVLREGGHAVLGGIMEREAGEVAAAAHAAGFELLAEDLEADWWSCLLRR